MSSYLVGYDIKSPRRLARTYRKLCGIATPIQYSVFLLDCERHLLVDRLRAVVECIDATEDDLRVYRLTARGPRLRIGRARLPQGIVWTGDPVLAAYDRLVPRDTLLAKVINS